MEGADFENFFNNKVVKEESIWKDIFVILGVLMSVSIIIFLLINAYTIYQDGSLISPVTLICGNQTNNQVCEKQDCTNECKPEIKIEINNTANLNEIKEIIKNLNCSN